MFWLIFENLFCWEIFLWFIYGCGLFIYGCGLFIYGCGKKIKDTKTKTKIVGLLLFTTFIQFLVSCFLFHFPLHNFWKYLKLKLQFVLVWSFYRIFGITKISGEFIYVHESPFISVFVPENLFPVCDNTVVWESKSWKSPTFDFHTHVRIRSG